uniref:Uncharacterized protein n=1 Tax=Siphoviridae sp. ctyg07 TaxID=2825747 RepID=A0A8S5VCK0_9CAUD|nr:MAG TPA: hypothetical protein [Siphoviridae sp. ctyg07]
MPPVPLRRAGVLLCLPAVGVVRVAGVLSGHEWCPRMGGVLRGAQIGSCGVLRACVLDGGVALLNRCSMM